MDIGVIVVWLCLVIYMIVVYKAKIIEKKERKWAYLLVGLAVLLSLLAAFNITFNPVISMLNDTFGKLSRLVVNK